MSKVFQHSSTSNFGESFPKVYCLKLTHSRRVVAMFARNRFLRHHIVVKLKLMLDHYPAASRHVIIKLGIYYYSITQAVLNQSRT